MTEGDTIKLFDKLFIGDQDAARDQEFILKYQVSLVINLTHHIIPNYFTHYGIQYLNSQWPPNPHHLTSTLQSIEKRIEKDEVVFVHGGQSLESAQVLGSIFLMCRFRWSLYKTIQFMQSRVSDLLFSQQAYQMLKDIEMDLLKQQIKLSYNWEQRPSELEELVIRNTYLNSCGKQDNKPLKKVQLQKKNKKLKRVTFQVQTNQRSSSSRVLKSNKQQNISSDQNVKTRILVSVRKILSDATNKQNCKINKKKDTTSSTSLQKHKSSYILTSLRSLSSQENRLPSQQATLPSFSQKQSRNTSRMKTQLSEVTELQNKKMKTEGGQAKPVIEIKLSKSDSVASKINKSRNNVQSKRKQGQSKVALIFANK